MWYHNRRYVRNIRSWCCPVRPWELKALWKNEVEIIDYKTEGEPGPGERSRQLLLYAHGFKHRYPEYTVRRLSLELLSKPKPRVYELDGAEYVSSGVAPLNANVLSEMVDTAESILHDYRHGFERVDDGGQCRDCGYRLYCV